MDMLHYKESMSKVLTCREVAKSDLGVINC